MGFDRMGFDRIAFRIALAALLVVMALVATAAAQGPARTLYKVTGVSPNDVLNVRTAPLPEAPVIASIASDATGLTRTGRTTTNANTLWAEIGYKGISGWVAARYIVPDMAATARGQPGWQSEVKSEPRLDTPAPGTAARVALLIGNGRYPIDSSLSQLAQPPHDARDLAVALKAKGFDVIQLVDGDLVEIRRGLADFKARSAGAETGIVFFGGHALQHGGESWLMPIGSRVRKAEDLRKHALPLAELLAAFGPREPRQAMVWIDASRDNRLLDRLAEAGRKAAPATAPPAKGLGRPASPRGGLTIAYAAEPGMIALDGMGRNSAFVDALLAGLKAPERPLAAILAPVREAVQKASNGRQAPWFEEVAAPEPRAPAPAPGRRRPTPGGAAADAGQ